MGLRGVKGEIEVVLGSCLRGGAARVSEWAGEGLRRREGGRDVGLSDSAGILSLALVEESYVLGDELENVIWKKEEKV